MSKSTMVELVDELKKLPQTDDIRLMVEEALAGEYHDFKNNKYVCGKMQAVTRLDSLGFHDLASRIKDGEFDEDPDEADLAEMRKYLPKEAWDVFKL